MANECCKLVGNLSLSRSGCFLSFSMNSRTEVIKECDGEPLVGPSTGTVSVTAYMDSIAGSGGRIYSGCQSSANVSIPWTRKYDCETDTVHYINAGKGTSSVIGDTAPHAVIKNEAVVRRYPNISASVGSGPTTIYALQEQVDGYGLRYTGGPIDFDSDDENSLTFTPSSIIPPSVVMPTGITDLYLQSFNLNLNPGEIPQVSYSFAFGITDG